MEYSSLLTLVVICLAFYFFAKKSKSEEVISDLRKIVETQASQIEEMESEREKLKLQANELERAQTKIDNLKETVARLDGDNVRLAEEVAILSKYRPIVDAEAKARAIITAAQAAFDSSRQRLKAANDLAMKIVLNAKKEAMLSKRESVQAARIKDEQAMEKLRSAQEDADRIIANAKQRAEEIAGDAYAAKGRADEFSDIAKAMKNIIKGYGDDYIVPTYSLLDELADEFGFTDAGTFLKNCRNTSRGMVRAGIAGICDYAEETRRKTAIRFVVDAFNGKVDSILSRSKADNHGKLAQEIRDAFVLVNFNGEAFRNARITGEYLQARLEELKWAATVQALRDKEREEQRRIREEMREEEKARREYERAMKEAAKEEEAIRRAMEKVQQQVAAANEAQRAEYEAKLRNLEEKLQAAEEKNQRAMSMAQQTRTGHVYVISNIGSFGEDVFKIGMTRRLDPGDRIAELGDASVPFGFDIHAMIFSEDAPGLEKTLHNHFLRQQMNKINPRKEFFRLNLMQIRHEIESLGIDAHWTMAADAHEYRETLKIEQQIRESPQAEREWARNQLETNLTKQEEEAMEIA